MVAQRRREQERRARWEQIVDGARKVFFEKGYHHATIEDIERACGLTRGSIYYHFSGKDELYIAVLLQGVRLLREELRWVSHDSAADPEELVIRLLDAYCEFYRDQKEYHRILQYYTFGWDGKEDLGKNLVDEINRLIFECLQEVVTAVERGVRQGLFTIEEPFLESVLMWCMVDSALGKTVDNPRTAFLGVDWETMKAGLRRNILNNLRPQPSPEECERRLTTRNQ